VPPPIPLVVLVLEVLVVDELDELEALEDDELAPPLPLLEEVDADVAALSLEHAVARRRRKLARRACIAGLYQRAPRRRDLHRGGEGESPNHPNCARFVGLMKRV
jgi:hypothetical protein